LPDNHDVAANQPLTIEQLVSYDVPEEPHISPDGSRIAFVVSPVSKEEEHRVSTIWLAPFQSGEAAQFSGGQWNDRCPRWSPDGRQIAFLSDRAERGKNSLYVAPVDGGEARRIIDQQGKMADPRWSPSGDRITVLITDPETDEEKKRKEERDDATVWDTNYKFQRLWSINPATREATAISPENVQVWSYAWSADGSKIALNTSSTPRYNDTLNETDVSIIDPDGTRMTHAFSLTGTADDMVWSADGQQLAYRAASGKAITGDTVFSRTVSGGDPCQLTPDYAGTAEHILPLNGGEAILFTGVEGINTAIYRLDWNGTRHRLTPVGLTGYIGGPPTSSEDGIRISGIKQDMVSPPELWTFGGEHTAQKTTFNDHLKSAAIGEPEVVRWTSDPGVEVEGILYKPHGFTLGARYPLVVSVHGGPTWLWANVFHASWHDWGAVLAGRGIAVLLPNPRGSTGRGSKYMNALFGEVGGNEYRDMMSGVDAMIERGIADPERLGIGGWSWGGYMTAWAITRTDRFKAAIVGAGLPNMIADNSLGDIPSANLSYFEKSPYEDPDPYFERSAIRYISNVKTPTLVLHGEADTRVAPAQGTEMYVALQQSGVESQLVTYPREGHSIHERKHQTDLLQRVIGWYERLLLGKEEHS
jgi:dipeptidyl aminopeptidase/acylaminoacyl peptidase